MITEDYVSFKTAKLLKEKGFDCNTNCYYIEDSDTRTLFYSPIRENHNASIENNELDIHINVSSGKMSSPTLQMTMKWLREVHNLWCEISWEGKGLWCVDIFSLVDEEFIPGSIIHEIKSYEEACESAIKYCLENLI